MSHEHRTFRNPPSATPADVRTALDRKDIIGALDAMVGCALYGDGDWREAQELYLTLLDHDDDQVQALAASYPGHCRQRAGRHRALLASSTCTLARALVATGPPMDLVLIHSSRRKVQLLTQLGYERLKVRVRAPATAVNRIQPIAVRTYASHCARPPMPNARSCRKSTIGISRSRV